MMTLLFAVHSGVPISLKTVLVLAQYVDFMIWWDTTPGLKTLLPEMVWIRWWESEGEDAGKTHHLLIDWFAGGAGLEVESSGCSGGGRWSVWRWLLLVARPVSLEAKLLVSSSAWTSKSHKASLRTQGKNESSSWDGLYARCVTLVQRTLLPNDVIAQQIETYSSPFYPRERVTVCCSRGCWFRGGEWYIRNFFSLWRMSMKSCSKLIWKVLKRLYK